MDQVASLGDTLRARVDNYVHDERFDSMFRATDQHVEAGVAGAVHESASTSRIIDGFLIK